MKNLLSFYLSHAISNFKYELIKKLTRDFKIFKCSQFNKLEDVTDKKKLKELEIAANKDKLDKKTIFEIYRQIPFNLRLTTQKIITRH